jgi:hypothetical protein
METLNPSHFNMLLHIQKDVPANPKRIIASYLEDHLVALGVKPVAQLRKTGRSIFTPGFP